MTLAVVKLGCYRSGEITMGCAGGCLGAVVNLFGTILMMVVLISLMMMIILLLITNTLLMVVMMTIADLYCTRVVVL